VVLAAPGKSVFSPHRQMLCGLALPPPAVVRFVCTRCFSCELSGLRAFGADAGKSLPHAFGVDDIAGCISCQQILFFVWVGLSGQK
jgi:hypothetical protein